MEVQLSAVNASAIEKSTVPEESMPERICRIMQGIWPLNSQIGTGFMVGNHVLMTSALVLKDKAACRKCSAQFSVNGRNFHLPLDPDSLFIQSDYLESTEGKPIFVWKSQTYYAYTIVSLKYNKGLPQCFSFESLLTSDDSYSMLVWSYAGGNWRTNSSLQQRECQAKQLECSAKSDTGINNYKRIDLISSSNSQPAKFDEQSFGAPTFLRGQDGLRLWGMLVKSGSIVRVEDIRKHLACEGHLYKALNWDPKVSSYAQVYNMGIDAYRNGQWAQAACYFERTAQQGDPVSYYLMAQCYGFHALEHLGNDALSNPLQLFLKLCSSQRERLDPKNHIYNQANSCLAIKWYKEAIDLYDASKHWLLPRGFWGALYSQVYSHSLLTESHIMWAKTRLAILNMYQNKGTSGEFIQLLQEASDMGNLTAKVILAKAYFLGVQRNTGWVIGRNPEQGFALLKEAAEQPHASAYTIGQLAECYEKGIGTTINRYKAREWRIKAEQKGGKDAAAMFPSERRRRQLAERVIGQPAAVKAAADAINVALMSDLVRTRPSVLYFPGPSGVGKTELAKAIADVAERECLRYDLTEYQDATSITAFIGVGGGYVGHNEAPSLVDAVRQKPKAILLFDEIDKAHETVLKSLYNVFEDGKLADKKGNVANFTQLIIVMTSNLGAREIAAVDWGRDDALWQAEQVARRLLGGKIDPAFVGRIDAIVPFRPLSEQDLVNVMRLHVRQYCNKVREEVQVELTIDDSVWLPKLREHPELGARGVIRDMTNEIARLIANDKADRVLQPNDRVIARREGNRVTLKLQKS